MTLVMGFDEVMISSTHPLCEKELQEAGIPFNNVFGYLAVKRPGIDEFLIEMAQHYEIVLLTSNLKNMPMEFCLTYQKYLYIEDIYITFQPPSNYQIWEEIWIELFLLMAVGVISEAILIINM